MRVAGNSGVTGRRVESAAALERGLYVVATPIGNMGDLTPRARDVLAAVDVIACEDTRRAGVLLKRIGVANRLVSYHDHNKLRRTPELLESLRHGKRVALVCDAGTPAISDPGFYLVRAAAEAAIRVIPVPGASALLSALVVSGLPSDRFAFEGFLPRRDGRRRKRLSALARERRTLIFYEPARRAARLLAEMLELWGDRPAVLCRELTKRHEETIRGTLESLGEKLAGRRLQGEVVIVVQGHEGED